MALGLITRTTLGFPGRNAAGSFFQSGVPGSHDASGAERAPNDAAAFSTYIQNPDLSAVKLALPPRNGLRVRYIGIDPESAISSAHILLGGRGDDGSRAEISPGNPLIGDIREDFALVTIPISL